MAVNRIRQVMNKSFSSQSTASKATARAGSGQKRRAPSLMPLEILVLAVLSCGIGLWGFAAYRITTGPLAHQTSCQSLIDQAVSYTGKYCDQIGANKACYGNTTIQAQMIANASQRFSQRGDVADVTQIQSISASPLNLITNQWGIVIFRVMADLPSSVPGQTVTLMVFGNTNLDKTSTGLDAFYFSSELGQVVCNKMPMDGILITMPNGVGWTFNVNGTKLTLMGDASLKANKNGSMMVGLYKGAGQITSDGQTQYFGAGQSVSVNLGGPNGDQAISPPSSPQTLSPDELKVGCTMTGNYCTASAISTVDPAQAQAMIQSGLTVSSSTVVPPLPASTTVSSLPPTSAAAPTAGVVQTPAPAAIPTTYSAQPTTDPVSTSVSSSSGSGSTSGSSGSNSSGSSSSGSSSSGSSSSGSNGKGNGNGNGKCNGNGNHNCP